MYYSVLLLFKSFKNTPLNRKIETLTHCSYFVFLHLNCQNNEYWVSTLEYYYNISFLHFLSLLLKNLILYKQPGCCIGESEARDTLAFLKWFLSLWDGAWCLPAQQKTESKQGDRDEKVEGGDMGMVCKNCICLAFRERAKGGSYCCLKLLQMRVQTEPNSSLL